MERRWEMSLKMKRGILLAACFLTATVLGAATQPNFVIFIADDHGFSDSMPYGATDVRTPNMQRLASEGLTFTRMFVASPSCAPSRAALLTGLMPARNGAEANHSKPRAEIKKLPAFLQEHGYEVVAFGKVAHYGHGALYGFDLARHDTFNDTNAIPAALDFLSKRKSAKPLCLIVGTHEPHVPWSIHPTYDASAVRLPATHVDTPHTREFRARYYTDVTSADIKLGAIFDAACRSLGTNTLFIYTSDHGAQWPFGKWNLYDAGIRVPFLAVWPGVIRPGSKSNAMTSWVDVLPTLIELAGGAAPTGLDGRSFANVLREPAKAHRECIYATHTGDGDFNVYPIRGLRDGEWKYILNLRPDFQHATHINRAQDRDGLAYWREWEVTAKTNARAAQIVRHYAERPREELYHLTDDPDEQQNLAAHPEDAARLAAMRAQLEEWMQSQRDTRAVMGRPLLSGEGATPSTTGTGAKLPK
jgi:arylsulfatase A-like enzyme